MERKEAIEIAKKEARTSHDSLNNRANSMAGRAEDTSEAPGTAEAQECKRGDNKKSGTKTGTREESHTLRRRCE